VNKTKEEIPLTLKSLAVITLLVLGCSAAFGQGSFTLGFTSAGDLNLYCNYEEIQYGGTNNFYMQGIDNLQNGCLGPYNATIEGVKLVINVLDGAPVTSGPAYVYADNYFDAISGSYTGAQLLTITQIKPTKRLLHMVGLLTLAWMGMSSSTTTATCRRRTRRRTLLGSRF